MLNKLWWNLTDISEKSWETSEIIKEFLNNFPKLYVNL